MKKVVILGGYGTFGSLISEQLVGPECTVIIAGRNAENGKAYADSINAQYMQCDTRDSNSLSKVIEGAFLVINASGPFQDTDYIIPKTCINQGCHYIDLGDGRDYVEGITKLHQEAESKGLFVCVGASTSPAVTSAGVEALISKDQSVQSIKIALNAGNKNLAGVSTIASILAYVGIPVQVWQDKRWQTHAGWSLGEFVAFPEPVGRRRVQLCNVPDLELFPELFQADQVEFKAGVELTVFNYAISVLGWVKQVFPRLNLPGFAKSLVSLSKLFKSFGTLHGGCAVWATNSDGVQKSIAFVAPQNGPRIPTAPAVLLSRKLLKEGPPGLGTFPCIGFIHLDAYQSYLEPFDISIVFGENGNWQ
ncbi:MAG: saccharopine dehydrogenase NADP-binding domain-containing protein [Anaerolineae bacterium]